MAADNRLDNSSDNSLDSGVNKTIDLRLRQLCRRAKLRLLLARLITLLPFLLLQVLVLDHLQISALTNSASAIITMIVVLLMSLLSKKYQQINQQNLLLHLNRQDQNFEESAQLLMCDRQQLNQLQRLQQDKLSDYFSQRQQFDKFANVFAKIRVFPWLSMTVIVLIIHFYSNDLTLFFTSNEQVTNAGKQAPQTQLEIPSLIASQVVITPPAYTLLPQVNSNSLDLEVFANSDISWQIEMSDLLQTYYLIFADGIAQQLTLNKQGLFQLEQRINSTGLYRIAYSEQYIPLPDVYALAVQQDEKPKIKILTPQRSISKIAKTAVAKLHTEVLISDDFAISKVEILASVAKGSGESVKFRDQIFKFEHITANAVGSIYEKTWDLKALGMAPGDEVYFTVYAWDNRQDKPQQSRSTTLIVRWLDDEIETIGAEGILINFDEEYFRSQRQIIIETEQLIIDLKELTAAQLQLASADLGRSQSDLKQRYGQYLGDEFEESASEEFAANTDVEVMPSQAELDEKQQKINHQAETASKQIPEHGHEEHDHNQTTDKSGTAQLLARFGHNHGEADIGPITKRNPKALMKRAVSIMWQAELHLMLAEPEKALPFEQQAYKYLKLAKQADRIYVQRLGFEPPPVKEDKRLTGKLDDIVSNNITTAVAKNTADGALFATTFQLLNEQQFNPLLTPLQLATLTSTKKRLTQLAQSQPSLIKHAATIESIIISQSIATVMHNGKCHDCIEKLIIKLWQLLPSASALPTQKQMAVNQTKPLYKDYLRRRQQLIQQRTQEQQ
ncbi:hypothetical protein AADZ86_12500 [Colwelliaceae bacterium BS250]